MSKKLPIVLAVYSQLKQLFKIWLAIRIGIQAVRFRISILVANHRASSGKSTFKYSGIGIYETFFENSS